MPPDQTATCEIISPPSYRKMPRTNSTNKTPTNKTMVTSAKKRVAIQSPAISPQKDTDMDNTPMQDLTTTKTPTLDSLSKYKMMTPEEIQNKVAGDDWKSEWHHPQIMQELLSDPHTPNPIDVIPYEFNREDTTTNESMVHTLCLT